MYVCMNMYVYIYYISHTHTHTLTQTHTPKGVCLVERHNEDSACAVDALENPSCRIVRPQKLIIVSRDRGQRRVGICRWIGGARRCTRGRARRCIRGRGDAKYYHDPQIIQCVSLLIRPRFGPRKLTAWVREQMLTDCRPNSVASYD